MSDEYQKGQELGRVEGQLESIEKLLTAHIKKQDDWNEKMDKRVTLAEVWIQTTTGKVIILTTIFGVVGSLAYIIINWFINHRVK